VKRGTPEHPKTIDLAQRLGVPRYVAVGILESLWHFTSEFAPQGNIGKFTDAAIAGHIHWEKTCKELVTSLIEAKWVDKCAKHRLIVHDWHEHADQTVKRWLDKRSLQFLKPEQVKRSRGEASHASTKLANASTEKADPPPEACLPLPLPLPLPEPLPEPLPRCAVLQGRRPAPPDLSFNFEAWFLERMRKHTNPERATNAARLLAQHPQINDPEWRAEFERVHDLWLQSERWLWKNGARVKPMDELVTDQFWLYPPPVQMSETERAMANL
jgi:hypothetical protein